MVTKGKGELKLVPGWRDLENLEKEEGERITIGGKSKSDIRGDNEYITQRYKVSK